MPRSRSRSPSRRRGRERHSEDILRSGRDHGYSNRGGRLDDDRRGRRRDDYEERPRDRRDRYDEKRKGALSRERDRSPSRKYDDRRRDRPRSPEPGPSSHHSKSKSKSKSRDRSRSPSVDKAKPNFKPSGLLAAETNTVTRSDGTSTFLKYNEPPEARRPSQGWRLYVFKGKEQVDLLHIHRQSAYLVGRDRVVCDIPVEHPSCSKQHAVIQFRHVAEKDELGNVKATVKPFIIDLESTNGTTVNDEAIPISRYFELRPSDVIKFGESLREYVLLHDDV